MRRIAVCTAIAVALIAAMFTASPSLAAPSMEREDLIWVQMRDGVRLSATLLFPSDRKRERLPTILVFSPYPSARLLGFFDKQIQRFIGEGYAVALVNSRGRYFSEGTYTFLGGSGNDGYDTIDWLSKQPWSSGKVGTFGCSSSAEEQHKMNAMRHPAHAAAVPMGAGAGIGAVGPYRDMGGIYRGGVRNNMWFYWLPNAGRRHQPSFPPEVSRDDLLRLSRHWNLEPEPIADEPIRIERALDTLPLTKVLSVMDALPSDLDQFITWEPNDPRWRDVQFGFEGDRAGAPTLYISSFYDMSIGPNLAMFEYQTRNAASATARDNMFMIVAPTQHCMQGRIESEHTIVGERDVGDARFDYDGFIVRWFDRWLKGVDNGITREPKLHAYLMGANAWRTYDTWPPRAKQVTLYLDSDGHANTREGNGRLSISRPRKAESDGYVYDPLQPTPTVGGQFCCTFPSFQGGAFDQQAVQMRDDVLVYTSAPLTEEWSVTGPIQVRLYLSSNARDTDVIVKLADVYPDGRAFNLDEGVLRARWREGYERPVFMHKDRVYRIDLPPLVTSNAFGVGHRIRIAISSSSFPLLERNLNTGGSNFDEAVPVIARNRIHHGSMYPSAIVLPVVATATPERK